MLKLVLLLPALACAQWCDAAPPRGAPPSFAHYAIHEKFSGKKGALQLQSAQDKEFRSQLAIAAKGRPNFAGHFILTMFGCGSSCVMSAVIDAKSGRVVWLPFTVCCGDYRQTAPVEFHLDSSLLVIRGKRDEGESGTYFYTFEAGQFKPIATFPE